MKESGSTNGGQSLPLCHGAVDGGKTTNSRRCCSLSRRNFLFFILVFAAVLFFYNTRVTEMSSDWLMRYNTTTWRTPFTAPPPSAHRFKSKESSPTVKDSTSVTSSSVTSLNVTGPNVTGPNVSGPNVTSLNVTSPNVTGPSVTGPNVTGPNVTTNKPEPPTPIPYKSPGPYLVEYPYEYHYTINEPNKCQQNKPFLVLMVPVAPSNRAHRDIIRSTWGNESLVQGKAVQLFFLLGQHSGEGAEKLQEQLLQESKEHGDLIQSTFLDCYKNLTIKTMVMMEWVDSHCSGTSYVMKIDSDMFLNVPKLISMLLNSPKTNYLTGLVARGAAVLRDRRSKWYLPASIYPRQYYPRYALGLGYVFSVDMAKKLVEASRHVKAVYIEDVYVGLCMQHLNIPPTDPPNWGFFHVFPMKYSRCAYSKLIATTTNKQMDRVWAWKDFKKPGPPC